MKKLMFLFVFIFLISFTSAVGYFDEGVLFSYYNLDETSGNALDIYGQNDLINNGSTQGVEGKVNLAYDFDGISNNVNGTGINPNAHNNGLSYTAWFYVDSLPASEMDILGHPQNGSFGSIRLSVKSDGALRYRFGCGSSDCEYDNINAGTISTGQWYFIAITHNSTTDRLYLNNTLINQSTAGGTLSNNLEAFSIGANNGTVFFNGKVDEVGVWNTSLSETNVSSLWNSGLGLGNSISVSLLEPAQNSTITSGKQTIFKANIESPLKLLVNASLYLDGILNETISITGNQNISTFTKSIISNNPLNWSVKSCNVDNCSTSLNRTVNFANWTEDTLIYPSSVLVGDLGTFSVLLNVSPAININSANLVYNSTSQEVSIASLSNNQYNITKTLTIPQPSGTIPFYFNFSFSNGQNGNSTSQNITVGGVGIDDCSVYTNVLYNFTSYDEKTKIISNVSLFNSTFNSQLWDLSKTVSISNYSKIFTNTNPFSICLENPLTSISNFSIDVQVQYETEGYAKEFYNIYNDYLDIDDAHTNISLYDLDNVSSQEFKIIYRDASFSPIENAIIQIQRKYVGEGLFRTVEQLKTDSNGEALAHLEVDDVIYNFIILENNIVTASFNNVIAVCQNPTLNECEISLTDVESFVEVTDFLSIKDLSFTGITYNKTTREVATTFSITSGTSATIVLNVTLFDGLGNTEVCSKSLTSSSGTLSCIIPTSFGNSTVIATITKNGVKFAENIISLAQDPKDIYGANLVFTALIIFVGLIGMGVTGNPIVMGMFLILSSVALIGMNIVYSTGFVGAGATILWFIVAVVIIMFKGANR